MLGPRIGSRIILLEETDSTNSHASRLLHSSFPEEGTVIMAQFQKAGRGQRGSGWESEHGENLTVSYILFPEFLPSGHHFMINQVISLAVADTVSQLSGQPAFIKWPNDIICQGGKIAGILIENTLRNTRVIQSIAGVGININQVVFQDYIPSAISIRQITGAELKPESCLDTLNGNVDKWYALLKIGKYEKIRKAYDGLLFRKGLLSEFETEEGPLSATITGVSEDGRLVVTTGSDDQQLFYNNKTIRLTSYY